MHLPKQLNTHPNGPAEGRCGAAPLPAALLRPPQGQGMEGGGACSHSLMGQQIQPLPEERTLQKGLKITPNMPPLAKQLMLKLRVQI